MEKYIGIDIGGTKCAVILGEAGKAEPAILERISFPTETQKGPEQALQKIVEATGALIRRHCPDGDVKGIGISCGGPLDSTGGVILSPPNLPGWDNIRITQLLEDRLGIPARLQNDANACALAEWRFGAGRGLKNVIFLTFGTGLGAGLILDGRLYSGTSDMAGEVGHIRLRDFGPVGYGKAGSFEGFCSGGGIAQLAKTMVLEKFQAGERVGFCAGLAEIESLNAKIVGDAAEAGDKLAVEIYRLCGRQLGFGLSILIDILNPQRIIIGSIFSRSRDLLWPYAHEIIESEALRYAREVCDVVPSSLGEKLGDYASLAVAF